MKVIRLSPSKLLKIKRDLLHIAGGFMIGLGFVYLFDAKQALDFFQMGIRFAMFLTLMLLGMSYLGE